MSHEWVTSHINRHFMTERDVPITRYLLVMKSSFVCDVTDWYVTWLTHKWHDVPCRQTPLFRDVTHLHVTWSIDVWYGSPTSDMTSCVPCQQICIKRQMAHAYATQLNCM